MAKKESAKKQAQNKKNLKPGGHRLTKEEQSKGGKKSQEIQRRRRNMAEDIKALLSMPMEPDVLDNIDELKSLPELAESNVTAQEIMLYQLILKGMKGDRESIRLVYEMTGDEREQADDNDAVLKFIKELSK